MCAHRFTPEDDDDADAADDSDDEDDEEGEEEEEDDDDTKVNGTAVAGLLEWEEEMDNEVNGFEKDVHPHGRKWWRYRYEYTLVEGPVLAISVMVMYILMYLLASASFMEKFKFYNIGLTGRLYRYCWAYFIFHATALMIMVTVSYMLYMPWGEWNPYDYLAKNFHEFIDGRANVPFLGYSWLMMMLDVQLQLFVTFSFYAIFMCFVVWNWSRALNDWKSIGITPDSKGRLGINEYHYNDFQAIMTSRVRESESFIALFAEKRLRYNQVEGVDSHRQQGFNDFHLHLYLTDSFGRAIEFLVEASLKSHLFLAFCAILVAVLAHHYEVAFMYFLPGFIVIGLFIFSCSFIVTRQLRDHNHNAPLDFLTVHAYCRSIQLCLYCVFFSFARLLLSSDIFTDYPNVYLAAAIGFCATLLLCWFVAGEAMKATICMIILPHASQEERFAAHLQSVAYWHTVANCHECGVRQHPPNACINREWAGTNQTTGSPRSGGSTTNTTSGRDFSFR